MPDETHVATFDGWEDCQQGLVLLVWQLIDGLEGHLGTEFGSRPLRIELHLVRTGEEPTPHTVASVDPCSTDCSRIVEQVLNARLRTLPTPFEGTLQVSVHHGTHRHGADLPIRVGLSNAPAMALSHWRGLATHWQREATKNSRMMGKMFEGSSDVIHASAQVIQASRGIGYPHRPHEQADPRDKWLRFLLDPETIRAVAEQFGRKPVHTPGPEPEPDPQFDVPHARPSSVEPTTSGPHDDWLFDDQDEPCSSTLDDQLEDEPPWMRAVMDLQH